MSDCGSCEKCEPKNYYLVRTFAGYVLAVDNNNVVVDTTYHKKDLIVGHRILGVVHVDDDFTNQDNYLDWDIFRDQIVEFGFSFDHIKGQPNYTLLLLIINKADEMEGKIMVLSPGPFGIAEVNENIFLS